MPPIRTVRDTQGYLTIHTVSGEVSLDEVFECVRHYQEAGTTTSTLWDFRNGSIPTTPPEPTDTHARQVAGLIPAERSGKVALVAEGNLEFGVLRMWSTFAEVVSDKLQLRLFHSYDNAIEWLGE